jgi:hypothetical protein
MISIETIRSFIKETSVDTDWYDGKELSTALAVFQRRLTPANLEGFKPCAHCGSPTPDLTARREGLYWRAEISCDCGVEIHGEEFETIEQAIQLVLNQWQHRSPSAVARELDSLGNSCGCTGFFHTCDGANGGASDATIERIKRFMDASTKGAQWVEIKVEAAGGPLVQHVGNSTFVHTADGLWTVTDDGEGVILTAPRRQAFTRFHGFTRTDGLALAKAILKRAHHEGNEP